MGRRTNKQYCARMNNTNIHHCTLISLGRQFVVPELNRSIWLAQNDISEWLSGHALLRYTQLSYGKL